MDDPNLITNSTGDQKEKMTSVSPPKRTIVLGVVNTSGMKSSNMNRKRRWDQPPEEVSDIPCVKKVHLSDSPISEIESPETDPCVNPTLDRISEVNSDLSNQCDILNSNESQSSFDECSHSEDVPCEGSITPMDIPLPGSDRLANSPEDSGSNLCSEQKKCESALSEATHSEFDERVSNEKVNSFSPELRVGISDPPPEIDPPLNPVNKDQNVLSSDKSSTVVSHQSEELRRIMSSYDESSSDSNSDSLTSSVADGSDKRSKSDRSMLSDVKRSNENVPSQHSEVQVIKNVSNERLPCTDSRLLGSLEDSVVLNPHPDRCTLSNEEGAFTPNALSSSNSSDSDKNELESQHNIPNRKEVESKSNEDAVNAIKIGLLSSQSTCMNESDVQNSFDCNPDLVHSLEKHVDTIEDDSNIQTQSKFLKQDRESEIIDEVASAACIPCTPHGKESVFQDCRAAVEINDINENSSLNKETSPKNSPSRSSDQFCEEKNFDNKSAPSERCFHEPMKSSLDISVNKIISEVSNNSIVDALQDHDNQCGGGHEIIMETKKASQVFNKENKSDIRSIKISDTSSLECHQNYISTGAHTTCDQDAKILPEQNFVPQSNEVTSFEEKDVSEKPKEIVNQGMDCDKEIPSQSTIDDLSTAVIKNNTVEMNNQALDDVNSNNLKSDEVDRVALISPKSPSFSNEDGKSSEQDNHVVNCLKGDDLISSEKHSDPSLLNNYVLAAESDELQTNQVETLPISSQDKTDIASDNQQNISFSNFQESSFKINSPSHNEPGKSSIDVSSSKHIDPKVMEVIFGSTSNHSRTAENEPEDDCLSAPSAEYDSSTELDLHLSQSNSPSGSKEDTAMDVVEEEAKPEESEMVRAKEIENKREQENAEVCESADKSNTCIKLMDHQLEESSLDLSEDSIPKIKLSVISKEIENEQNQFSTEAKENLVNQPKDTVNEFAASVKSDVPIEESTEESEHFENNKTNSPVRKVHVSMPDKESSSEVTTDSAADELKIPEESPDSIKKLVDYESENTEDETPDEVMDSYKILEAKDSKDSISDTKEVVGENEEVMHLAENSATTKIDSESFRNMPSETFNIDTDKGVNDHIKEVTEVSKNLVADISSKTTEEITTFPEGPPNSVTEVAQMDKESNFLKTENKFVGHVRSKITESKIVLSSDNVIPGNVAQESAENIDDSKMEMEFKKVAAEAMEATVSDSEKEVGKADIASSKIIVRMVSKRDKKTDETVNEVIETTEPVMLDPEKLADEAVVELIETTETVVPEDKKQASETEDTEAVEAENEAEILVVIGNTEEIGAPEPEKNAGEAINEMAKVSGDAKVLHPNKNKYEAMEGVIENIEAKLSNAVSYESEMKVDVMEESNPIGNRTEAKEVKESLKTIKSMHEQVDQGPSGENQKLPSKYPEAKSNQESDPSAQSSDNSCLKSVLSQKESEIQEVTVCSEIDSEEVKVGSIKEKHKQIDSISESNETLDESKDFEEPMEIRDSVDLLSEEANLEPVESSLVTINEEVLIDETKSTDIEISSTEKSTFEGMVNNLCDEGNKALTEEIESYDVVEEVVTCDSLESDKILENELDDIIDEDDNACSPSLASEETLETVQESVGDQLEAVIENDSSDLKEGDIDNQNEVCIDSELCVRTSSFSSEVLGKDMSEGNKVLDNEVLLNSISNEFPSRKRECGSSINSITKPDTSFMLEEMDTDMSSDDLPPEVKKRKCGNKSGDTTFSAVINAVKSDSKVLKENVSSDIPLLKPVSSPVMQKHETKHLQNEEVKNADLVSHSGDPLKAGSKLEPITLRLYKDNLSIKTDDLDSPKRNRSPKLPSEKRSQHSPLARTSETKCSLSPQTKQLEFTLKIAKDVNTNQTKATMSPKRGMSPSSSWKLETGSLSPSSPGESGFNSLKLKITKPGSPVLSKESPMFDKANLKEESEVDSMLLPKQTLEIGSVLKKMMGGDKSEIKTEVSILEQALNSSSHDSTSGTKKRGRPRKVLLSTSDTEGTPVNHSPPEPGDPLDPSGDGDPSSSRQVRSCRARTLPIVTKTRKPRGGGAGRGGGRGGAKGVARPITSEKEAEKIQEKLSEYEKAELAKIEARKEKLRLDRIAKNEAKKAKKLAKKLKDEERRKRIAAEKAEKAAAAAPQVFEEETRMSAPDSRGTTPAPSSALSRLAPVSETPEESQNSINTPNSSIKKGRMEIPMDPESDEVRVDQLAEYQWQGSDLCMIQEQVSLYLGVKSFKRKYPDLKRRTVEAEERTFLEDSGLVPKSMCDLGLTAVSSAEILDIMYHDFPDKYEEFRGYMREKESRELSFKQKALSSVRPGDRAKGEPREQALEAAAMWNLNLNRERREERRCSLDLQTFTVHYPKNARDRMARPPLRPGLYPVSVIPGQFSDYYKTYTPTELMYFPLNTVMYGPLKPNERRPNHSDGSDSSSSSSDDSSCGSDSEDEESVAKECKICNGEKKSSSETHPEILLQCSQCKGLCHPTCQEITPEMLPHIKKYSWHCSNCKKCVQCKDTTKEDKMLFCDLCDRGYHLSCVGLKKSPEGRWHCSVCSFCTICGSKDPGGPEWHYEYKKTDKGVRLYQRTLCVPCSKNALL